jgi:hypothetical protein
MQLAAERGDTRVVLQSQCSAEGFTAGWASCRWASRMSRPAFPTSTWRAGVSPGGPFEQRRSRYRRAAGRASGRTISAGPVGGAQVQGAGLQRADLPGHDGIPAAGRGAAWTTVATGLVGVGSRWKISCPAAIGVSQRASMARRLRTAAELAARHDFLTGITTLLEVDATDRLVIEHLRHEGVDDGRADPGDAGMYLGKRQAGVMHLRPAAVLPAGAIHRARSTPSAGYR